MTLLSPVTYATEQQGPKLLVLGAIHGNEKCGTGAIKRILQEIDKGEVTITRGSVTFIPICNPRAYEKDVRFTERNLNRYLVPMEKPDCYEAELGNELCPMLAACDVLLDIHSYTVGGPAFVFVGENDTRGNDFARALGDVSLVTGWATAYANSGRKKTEADKDESTGTTEYARRFGAMAATLECGQHKDPVCSDIAYTAIRQALAYLGLTNENAPTNNIDAVKPLVKVSQVYYREREGKLAAPWKHLDPVKRGQTIALYNDGAAVEAPDNGYIVLPHDGTPLGQEWFYFGSSH